MNTAVNLFVPIKSANVAHCFAHGCILPSSLYTNRLPDLQNQAEIAIILSHSKWVKGSDCSLEVVLTWSEFNKLEKLDEDKNFLLMHGFLPVSRIKRVYFLDEKQKNTTLWNINSGAAFLPEELVTVDSGGATKLVPEPRLRTIGTGPIKDDIQRHAKFYGHVLGGIALMNIAAFDGHTYSSQYLSILSLLSKPIHEQCSMAQDQMGLPLSRKYHGTIIKDGGEWERWRTLIYQKITVEEVERLAKGENFKPPKKLGQFQLDSRWSNPYLYDLAVMATYGDGKAKNVDNLVSDIVAGKIPSEAREEVALLFGLNYGYARLHNRYRMAKIEKDIKFRLTSKLDYYVIESVYQLSQNAKGGSGSFEYLDDWIPVAKPKPSTSDCFYVLDTCFESQQKPNFLSASYIQLIASKANAKPILDLLIEIERQWKPPHWELNMNMVVRYMEGILRAPLNQFVTNLLQDIKVDFQQTLPGRVQSHESKLEAENLKIQLELEEYMKKCSELEAQLHAANPPEVQKTHENIYQISEPKVYCVAENEPMPFVSSTQTTDSYDRMKDKELKLCAKDLGLKNYSKLRRQELIKLLRSNPKLL